MPLSKETIEIKLRLNLLVKQDQEFAEPSENQTNIH